MSAPPPEELYDIAVVGLAGRFRDAPDTEHLWRNLEQGRESIRFFEREELVDAGVERELLEQPEYVLAKGMLEDAELFDASFFGLGARDAALRDPQHRLFLECAWEALENGACDPARFAGPIGVFAGASASTYLMDAFLSGALEEQGAGALELMVGNDLHFLSTFASYWLDLKGPSVSVATACSTSLVAVHLACQSLLQGECDAALAGGVTINFPQRRGYLYQEGGVESPDGHCRAFDARGRGTVAGEGAGVVFLRRLRDALEDGDPVRALIKGSAVNNDGRRKIGFTAPSIEGQTAVISEAHAMAGTSAESITFVEAHGSGTVLGDPVEVRSLTRAFRESTEHRGFCALGSIKTNLGHLDSAAGVAGLIKTVLALEHRRIPPTLHFETPNPELQLQTSPFYVPTEPRDWPPGPTPRRAGVSSLGIGGTNVHVVLEEAPAAETLAEAGGRDWNLLCLSAASPGALTQMRTGLREAIHTHTELPLADVAYTIQVGRRRLGERLVALCRDPADAIEVLAGRRPDRLWRSSGAGQGTPVAFLFSGVGDHYAGMSQGLYRAERVFRHEIDRGADVLEPLLGVDPRRSPLLRGERSQKGAGLDLGRMVGRGDAAAGARELGEWRRASRLHPVVFLLEYALARLWQSWGVVPGALFGYSLGELTAATVAGVFSLEDALRTVVERARAVEQIPGAMLAVPMAERDLARYIVGDLALAAVNGPELAVISGPRGAVAGLEERLRQEGAVCRRLDVESPLHSSWMEPAAAELARFLEGVELRPPELPWVSGATGTWATPTEATDPAYWARQLCRTVRFKDAMTTLDANSAMVEIGPGHGLVTLALQQHAGTAVPSLPPAYAREEDLPFILGSLGRLWLAGVEIDWHGFHRGSEGRRQKVALPTYPFERRRYALVPEGGRRTGGSPAHLSAHPSADRTETRTTSAPTSSAAAPAPSAAPALSATPAPSAAPWAAPVSPIEIEIADAWRRLLHVERVGLHDNFFHLGGHSLLAPQLLLTLRRSFAVDVPMAAVLARPTVAELAALVERLQAGEAPEAADTAALDLRREVELDPAIRPESWDLAGDPGDPEAVLLTGASGFLGAFLLRDLLRHTRARVHCLVRAENLVAAAARVRGNLEFYGLWDDAWAPRIVPVTGDLAAPLWGLPEGMFHALAHGVEAIYHCGAWVNFTYPYSALKAANTGGTSVALRLAAQGPLKPLHLISTLAVFEVTPIDRTLYEESPATAPGDGPIGGYPASKWVAEKLVERGRERGIPASIYRPGIVGGDSSSGAGNDRDMIWNFLKGCLQLGAAPEVDTAFDPAPVDYVSRALVHLSLDRALLGGTFHLVNPDRMPWREVFHHARKRGYELRSKPWEAWRADLVRTLTEKENDANALRPFWPLLTEELAAERSAEMERLERDLRFDDAATRAALAGTTIRCPAVDSALLDTYFRAWIDRGFLPPPPENKSADP